MSRVQQWQHDVFECSRTWEQIEALKNETDASIAYVSQFVGRHTADSLAREPVLTARRSIQAADEIHECGFAGARRSHHSYKFTRIDLQRDSTQSTNASLTKKVSLFQVTYSNYRLCRRSGSSSFIMFIDSRGALLALRRWLIIVGSHNVSL